MRHLYAFQYWGDARLPEWKIHWDDLVRNQRVPPEDKVLEEIFVPLCRQSARLSAVISKYDLAFKDDEERSYPWMDRMVEKVTKEDRSRVNLTSLAAGSEAAANPKKQPAAPGTTGGNPGGDHPANPTDPSKSNKKDQKGGKGGKGDKGGKKGKGKDQSNGVEASPGGGNTPRQPFDPNRSCILNLFGKCKHGAILGKGAKCERGTHRKKPLDSDKTHPFFKKMEKEHGVWAPGAHKYPDGTVAAPAQATGVGTNGNAGSTPPGTPKAGDAPPQGGAAR